MDESKCVYKSEEEGSKFVSMNILNLMSETDVKKEFEIKTEFIDVNDDSEIGCNELASGVMTDNEHAQWLTVEGSGVKCYVHEEEDDEHEDDLELNPLACLSTSMDVIECEETALVGNKSLLHKNNQKGPETRRKGRKTPRKVAHIKHSENNRTLDVQGYLLKCKICSLSFLYEDDFIAHTQSHDPVTAPTHKSNSMCCNDCGKLFYRKKNLARHVVIHRVERPYTCDICKKTFKRQCDVNLHKKRHTADKMLICDLCDFKTIYRTALETHVRRHYKDYPFNCNTCGKGFFIKSYLDEHKNFHTGEEPFKCEVCGKSFPYTRYLKAHQRANHPTGKDPRKINKCETCGREFVHKKSLLAHIKSHTGENVCLCEICGKSLTSKEHLKFHRRIHTGEKPNVCDICGKGFAKSCNLTLHLRVHTGERPYKCEVCCKSFSQRSTLVIHMRYHSGQRPYTCDICKKGFVCKALLTIHRKGNCMPEDL